MERELERSRAPRRLGGRTMTATRVIHMTEDEWNAEGVRLFGEDRITWRFVCPSCGHVASVQDWKDAGAKQSQVAFNCVGRHTGATRHIFEKPGPCNYTAGGLFTLNPVLVHQKDGHITPVFAFAGSEEPDHA
jgi:hypothetical protein